MSLSRRRNDDNNDNADDYDLWRGCRVTVVNYTTAHRVVRLTPSLSVAAARPTDVNYRQAVCLVCDTYRVENTACAALRRCLVVTNAAAAAAAAIVACHYPPPASQTIVGQPASSETHSSPRVRQHVSAAAAAVRDDNDDDFDTGYTS